MEAPTAQEVGYRIALSVLRDALDDERRRSDARLVALVRIADALERDEGNAAEALGMARSALAPGSP